ncbi:MAG TPA: hypothetical protein VF301_09760 [Ginsengibacter sp.]
MKISYLPQANIDKQKWDYCIDNAGNGLIYAYSFYLDAMSKNWDALILDDYEIVMPLTWNKKYTIHYLYQPFFCAQLGIFGNNISSKIVKVFFENISSKFKYWDFYLNKDNLFSLLSFPMYERSNYVLLLQNTYENLAAKFAQSHVRNIKRALKQENMVKKNIPITDVISLAQVQTKKFSPITEKDYNNFSKLFEILKKKKMAVTYGVYSANDQLTASCAYVFSHNRAYYILVGNHPDGRTSGASHLMIDHFIKEHAGENLILDFEGSNISSLAFFYKSFGSTLEKYPGIKMNKLPAIAKLFRQ